MFMRRIFEPCVMFEEESMRVPPAAVLFGAGVHVVSFCESIRSQLRWMAREVLAQCLHSLTCCCRSVKGLLGQVVHVLCVGEEQAQSGSPTRPDCRSC